MTSNGLNESLRNLELAALRVDADFSTDVRELQARTDLTPSGKREVFERMERDRQARVQALQQQARDLTGSRRLQAARAVQAAKLAEFEKLRNVLGDQILSDVIRRKLAVRNPAEIRRMIEESSDGFELILTTQLALAELETRVLGTSTPQAEDMIALTELKQATEPASIVQAESAAREIPGDDWIGNLDVKAYRVDFAEKMRLDAEHVAPPF